ncbi:MAG: ABC transporter permease, partial [Lachnospiraceae bacterium]|nr:ABC transporter permease [Lachnospiraceae bacterium]
MNVLKKLTIKDLKLNKKRTIVTIIGIMLSVALITAVATMFQSFIDSMIKYEKRQKGDYHVRFGDVPYEEVVNIKNNRSVEDTYLIENIGYAVLSDSKNEYMPYAFVMGFTDESEKKLGINLVEGRFPENENEIVIPTHLKTNGRVSLSVGDTITLDVGKRMDSEGNELTQYNPYITSSELEYMNDEESNGDENTEADSEENDDETDDEIYDEYKDYSESIVDTETKTYTVVGICERPSMEDYEAPGYTFITHIDEENMQGKVQVYVRYKKKVLKDAYKITAGILGIDAEIYEKYEKGDFNSEEEYQQVFELLKNIRYSFDFNYYLIELEDNPLSKETLGSFGIVVVIVCIIIIVTSVFCIKNSFDISITEKIREYGMLRSVGATKKQIRKNVMYEALILGLIGIPLGILCGELASFILIKVSNLLMMDELFGNTGFLVFSPSVIAIVISIMLGAITIYLSAFRSAFKASRVSPIVSIRNSGDIKVKAKKLKSPKPIKKIFGMGGEISYKNLKRNKKKYRTTIISITVSVIIFVALSSFMKMAFNLVRHQVDIREYDVSVNIYTHYSSGNQFTDDKEIYEKLYSTSNFDNIKECAFYRETTLHDSSLKYSDKYKELMRYDEWYDGEEADIYVEVIVPDDKTYRSYIDSL